MGITSAASVDGFFEHVKPLGAYVAPHPAPLVDVLLLVVVLAAVLLELVVLVEVVGLPPPEVVDVLELAVSPPVPVAPPPLHPPPARDAHASVAPSKVQATERIRDF
jgi:hypothetical protein